MVSDLIIPSSVTSIGDNAFCYCKGLTSVSIPSSVTSIGNQAFYYCTGLTSVSIPSGVTSIGYRAFSGCKGLTSINIPSSVTSIGEGVFFDCTGLTSVTIPESVTSIGYHAFSGCKSLTSVNIPSSVTSIRYHAFSGCKSLTSVSIPSSVTSIEGHMFEDCSSLTSVSIPSSVTSIGDSAFQQCSSLTSVNIPSSVTSVGGYAFYDCSGLTSVNIPSSVTSIGLYAFGACNALTDVYYSGTEDKWNEIKFRYGNEPLKSATIHFLGVKPTPIPSNKYCIQVVDSDGNDLEGVTVNWKTEMIDQTEITDKGGKALFPAGTVGTPVITASLEGYLPWTNENSSWKKSVNRYSKVILYTPEEGGLKLQSAQYSSWSTMSSPTDLLTQTKKLNLKNDGNLIGDLTNGTFYLSCAATDAGVVSRYELWQNKKKIAETTNGFFGELSVTSFSKGGNCFIRAVGNSGKQVDTRINLTFAENTVNKDTGLSILKNKIKITVADDIPFLGGSTFEVGGVELLPVELKLTDEKLYIGLNAKIWDSSDTNSDQKKGKFDKFKRDLQKAKKAGNIGVGKRDADLINAMLKSEPDFELPGGKVKFNIIGYAEADWGSSTATGEIYIICKAETPTFGFTTWVWVVPVTANIKGEAEVQGGAKISYNWEDSTVKGEFPLTITLGLEAFGGVGVGTVVGVGAYGSAEAEFDTRLFVNAFLRSVDLTGELGLKAYFGPFEYTRAFAHQTWHLYTANNVGTMSLMGETEPWTAGLTDASQYKPDDLSYLSQESGWQGGGLRLMGGEASTQLTPLLSDTYRNARPVMLATDDALYAAFVRADQDSGDRYVVVTKYNGSTWSEPVRIDAIAVLDDSPVLCADNSGNVWLAYARTTDGWTDKTSLRDYATHQEIVVGKLDAENMTLSNTKTYASETGYVHSQTLSVVDGTPVLAWADTAVTDENSILAPETGSIRYAVCSGGIWSEATTLTSATPDQLAVGAYQGQTAVAYTVDGTLSCVTANGTVAKLADEVTGRVTYGTLPGAATPAFIWNEENTLKAVDGTAVAAEGVTKEYAIVGDSIYYSAADEDSANLMVLQYQNNAWGLPIQLTGDARYLENLSAARLNGQDYVFGMSTAVTISENAVDDAKNLVWSRVMPVSDLRLEDASYDVENAAAGEETTVTLTVTNAGDHTVNGFDIFVDNSKVETKACSLAPGKSMDAEITITCPSKLTTYTVKVAETGRDDYHPEDNAQTVTMGYTDAVVDLEYHQIGAQKALVATVTNEGISPASGSLLFYDKNGDVVAESTFESLASGDVAVAEYEFAADAANIIDGDVSVMAVVDQEEYYTFNNEASLFVSKPYQPTEIREATITNGSATAQVFCNEDDTGASVCCAFYKDGGQMIESKTAVLTADQLNELTYNLPDGTKTVKWFVMDGEGKPICESVERSIG